MFVCPLATVAHSTVGWNELHYNDTFDYSKKFPVIQSGGMNFITITHLSILRNILFYSRVG